MLNILTIILTLAFTILTIISMMKVLEKADEKGWKILIPFYNNYVFGKTFCKQDYITYAFTALPVILTILTPICLRLAFAGITTSPNPISPIGMTITGIRYFPLAILAIVGLIDFAITVLVLTKMLKSFDIQNWFVLLIIIFPFVAWPLIAFDDYEFLGPQ